jgi:integrase/recombinase XerC
LFIASFFVFMENRENVVESSAFFDTFSVPNPLMSALVDGFLDYAQYELNFCPRTIVKYRESLGWFIRDIGDKDIRTVVVEDFVTLKKLMIKRGVGQARIASVVFATRSFLNYCRNFLHLPTLNPKQIRPPRIVKREVIFLTKEEVQAFLASIDGSAIANLRFRAIVETILGTGMRISEVLSLNRKDIDWKKKEAKIIGKGNKERRVFFTLSRDENFR